MLSLLLCLSQRSQPDVVVFILDEVGYGDLVNVATPNIDALALTGVSFLHAYTHPVCWATRDSFLFGTQTGYFRGNGCDGLVPANAHTPQDRSIGDFFQALGYTTGYFGKWHTGPVQGCPWEEAPEALGFDTWQAGVPANVRGPCGQGTYTSWLRVDDGVVSTSTTYVDLAVRDAFLAWWDATPSPKFAVIAFQDAHEPYGTPPGQNPPQSPTNRRLFKKQIQGLDLWVGEIMAVVGPDPWVFLFGDNGTPGCDPATGSCASNVCPSTVNPFRSKKTSYQNGVSVPMIVSGGGLPVQGAVSEALVQPCDILATVAEGIGVAFAPVGESGSGSISFAPALEAPSYAGTRPWAYVFYDGGGTVPANRAVIEQQFKLLVDDLDGTHGLFDIQADPTELVNLYGIPAFAAEQARLEAILGGLP